jgi:hypothetical protein
MRKIRGWFGPKAALAALVLGLLAGGTAEASASPTLINYNTSGTVGLTGITGSNFISFNSVSDGAFVTPSTFSLGEFLVTALPPGVTTSYKDTPFSVTFSIKQVDSDDVTVQPITITGVLNGEISGPSQSSVRATFNPLTVPNFTSDGKDNNLSILGTTVSLVPSTTNGGRTTAQAQLFAFDKPVPEPATITVFVAAIAGLGIRHRMSRKRAS